MENACMISRKGKVIPVEAHPYMDYDFVKMNIKYGIWFYNNTDNLDVKQAYIDYLACQAKDNDITDSEVISWLINFCSDYKEVCTFIESHKEDILCSYVSEVDEKVIVDCLVKESNQEFMRVRYGGIYKTKFGVREIYFRISSSGFNWYNIIWQYVYDHKSYIDYVTIVRDLSSTGSDKYYYIKVNRNK